MQNSASFELRLIAVCFCISVHESSHLVSSENPSCMSDHQNVMKMSFPTAVMTIQSSQSKLFLFGEGTVFAVLGLAICLRSSLSLSQHHSASSRMFDFGFCRDRILDELGDIVLTVSLRSCFLRLLLLPSPAVGYALLGSFLHFSRSSMFFSRDPRTRVACFILLTTGSLALVPSLILSRDTLW